MRRSHALAPVLALSTVLLLSGCGAGTTSPSAGGTSPAAVSSTKPSASSKPAAAKSTVSETQALIAAKQYLAIGTGFSQTSLLTQLTSTSGNGFAKADAEWAVAHSGADWNAQAVDAAKGYMKIGGFSRTSLIQQLTSADGNGFTAAQASYAATKVGLN